jgi:hypothetical protein
VGGISCVAGVCVLEIVLGITATAMTPRTEQDASLWEASCLFLIPWISLSQHHLYALSLLWIPEECEVVEE